MAMMIVDGQQVAMTPEQIASVHIVPAADAVRYVHIATIRERVQAAGLFTSFAAALDALPAEKRWHLLTLREGVASDDADAIALLTAIGADPTAILAP